MDVRVWHRVHRTIYTILFIVIFGSILLYQLARTDWMFGLLTSFGVGLTLFITYEVVMYEHLRKQKKHLQAAKNSLTQVYIGSVALLSTLLALSLYLFFDMSMEASLFLLSALNVIILLASLRTFESHLDRAHR